MRREREVYHEAMRTDLYHIFREICQLGNMNTKALVTYAFNY